MKFGLTTAVLILTGAAVLQPVTTQAQATTPQVQARGAQPLNATPNATTTKTDAQINAEALRKTQDLLRNQAERQKAIANDPKAQSVDSNAKALLGANTEKAYELSAQLMERIVAETGGDPQKMQKLILDLQSNPQSLEKYLSPAQRDLIRQMASDVEKSKGLPPAGGSGH